jgi:hypothetical protein
MRFFENKGLTPHQPSSRRKSLGEYPETALLLKSKIQDSFKKQIKKMELLRLGGVFIA